MKEQLNTERTWIYSKINTKPDASQVLFSTSPYFTAPVKLSVYDGALIFSSSIKPPEIPKPPERKKHDIVGFSKNSRSRLFKFFGTISFKKYAKMYFVSLTFHNKYPETPEEVKKFLDNYVKRLKRRDQSLDYVWRFELQKRGAPHFHFIFFLKNQSRLKNENTFRRTIDQQWRELNPCNCSDCVRYNVKIDELCTYEKALSYVGKYVAKMDEENTFSYTGRKWGYSRTLTRDTLDQVEITCGQFIILKQKLCDFFRNDSRRYRYLLDNLKSSYSFYFWCEPGILASLAYQVISMTQKEVFEWLKKNKFIGSNYVFDEVDEIIRQHLNLCA